MKTMRDQYSENVLTGSFNLRNKYITYPVGQCFDREQIPWTTDSTGYPLGPVGLHKEIIDFYNYIKPTREEQFARDFVVSKIKEVALEEWPDCQVDIFGSFKTGLYLPSSDIDMVIFGKWDVLPLRTLEDALLRKRISSEIKVLDKATVPIVKMTDKETDLRVDISFNMINSVRAAEHMRMFMKSYPVLPYLVFVLKQYLLQRNLNEVWTGGLSSYALILMCISYLQHQIPPGVPVERVNLGVLLIEFFELYGRRFNYINTAIRVTNGGEYVPKAVVQQNMEAGLRPSILCIEDPLCPGNDVGRRSYCALQVKHAFEYAYALVSSSVLPHYSYLHWRSDVSILGRLLKISKPSLEHRQRIRAYGLRLMAMFGSERDSLIVDAVSEQTQSENEAKRRECVDAALESDTAYTSANNIPQSHSLSPTSVATPPAALQTADSTTSVHQSLSLLGSVEPDLPSGSQGEIEVRQAAVAGDDSSQTRESQQNDAEKPGDCTVLANELASLSTYMVDSGDSSASSCSHGHLDHHDCKRRCLRPIRTGGNTDVSPTSSGNCTAVPHSEVAGQGVVTMSSSRSPPLVSPSPTNSGQQLPSTSPNPSGAPHTPREGQSRKVKVKQSSDTVTAERPFRHSHSPLVVSIKNKTGNSRYSEQQPSTMPPNRRQAARRFSRQHSTLLEPDKATSGIC